MSKRRRSKRNKRRQQRLQSGPVFLGVAILIALGILAFGRPKKSNAVVESQPPAASPETAAVTPLPSPVAASQPETNSLQIIPPELPMASEGQVGRPNVTGLSQALQQRLDDVKHGRAQVIPLRDEWLTLLKQSLNPAQAQEIKSALGQLVPYWLWSPKVLSGDRLCTTYTVSPGDQLATIARKVHIPWELVGRINGISNPRQLKAYQKLKLVQGPFHAVVHKSSFTLDLYLQDTFVRSYDVALARPGKVTPSGVWKVEDRMRSAPWTDPETGITYQPDHPDYPLGPVWIPLEGISGDATGQPSYGIHGTNEPESIGTASSSGCVRLRNNEAEELYLLLQPGQSFVRVVD